ncbi:MAG TPA: HAMP domain-containing sensor histidine kinase [Candidatus Methylomirabilis sp.]|nr:HAMP domain-containing sensor histidine kinase [Candidatus Methylomirabilis sp.]
MRKLYLRIYLAVLASLAAFALVSGFFWRQFGNAPPGVVEAPEVFALPPAGAPQAAQQAALRQLAAKLQTDVMLFSPDRAPIAAGSPLQGPDLSRAPDHRLRPWRGAPGWVIHLPDGRWLVARLPRDHRHPGLSLFLTLALIALAVGVGAYPVVRRLTRRLERLQAGVESLGAGDLAARVLVEGDDEVARLAESFNRAASRIEELVVAHKSLLANASHELRTPLARIRMTVELMKQSAEPKRKADLERDVAELDALIDEILLASRLDAVTQPFADEDVDLLALATEECARYEEAELDGRPVTVRGDSRLLRRMIRNLLENARRHGAPPIEVRVGAAGNTVELRVCDHGPGIPETEREAVFRPFHRAPDSGKHENVGTGLGLALVRQIARRHGGEARCLAHQPSGSCFVVTFGEGPTS